MRKETYPVRLLSGETVNLTVRYDDRMEPTSDLPVQATKRRGETQRHLIAQPLSTKPTAAWQPPQPRDYQGQRIQVTAHVTENYEIVERWQFSDTDVRWYRLTVDGKPIVPVNKPVEQGAL